MGYFFGGAVGFVAGSQMATGSSGVICGIFMGISLALSFGTLMK